MPWPRIVAPILAAALALTACTGPSPGSADPAAGDPPATDITDTDTSVTDTTVTTITAGADGTAADPAVSVYHSLLASLPNRPDVRASVTITDVAAARAVLGLEAPATDAGLPERFAEFPQLFGQSDSGVAISPSGRIAATTSIDAIEAWTSQFGYSIVDVDREISAERMAGTGSVIEGRIDRGRVLDAARTDPVWAGQLAESEREGRPLLAWGTDGEFFPDMISDARPNGEGGRLVVLANGIGWSTVQSTVEAMADATAGRIDSLADDPDVVGLIEALAGEGLYEVFLSDDPLPTVTEAFAAQLFSEDDGSPNRIDQPPGMMAPRMIALGKYRTADGGVRNAVAMAYDDEPSVAANLDRLATMVETGSSWYEDATWADLFELEDQRVAGRFGVVSLKSPDPGLLLAVWRQRDSLFSVEQPS